MKEHNTSQASFMLVKVANKMGKKAQSEAATGGV